ncbi:cyclic AMP-dependent transcription factor ATF-6 alpha isoform X1 [Rissa tridactyla]|uniref:cyclic AMP-dependent transcription factor ATF-6 alpha isoform X1 n=1 Tax=Rissa tridactyla TaxID=75485 RepID=UPI0023BAA8E7|nr:cyclic AMP-dependent transcription factor ATF-6 alpha isoform X1 [Rissa tridactyla]
MLCAPGGSVSTAARRGPDAPGAAGSWARCVCGADMGAAAGRLQSAGRTWALSSRGICYLGIAAIAWGTVTQLEVGAWTYHYSDQGDYTWEQARNYCQTFFTDLVAIQNKQEIEYLNETLPFHGRYYWIGIRKLGGTWTWVGTRKALTKEAENWAAGEPNNRRSNQDCVEIYIKRQRESGKWNDEPCNRRKKALCYQASCQPFPCSQHGECVETIGSYRCECYPGFHGPECEDVVQCAKLEPMGVRMNCSHPYGDFSYNSTCVFGCQEGFERRGADTLRCLASQQWSAETPTCTAIACPVLSAPDRGEVNCSHRHGYFAFGSTCAFSCQTGFALMGPESRECTATGTWTGEAPHCEAITCPVLSAPEQGELNCSHLHGEFAFGSTCVFSCRTGFELTGPESHECTATGTWTGEAPRCKAIACPVLSAPDRGKVNCSHHHGDFAFGSTCAFSCQTGFVLMGPESRECTATGTWTGDAPRCEAVTCPVLNAPDQGKMNCSHLHGGFAFGSMCAFSCQMGFVLMGSESRECMATGTWTEDSPHCEAITCPVLNAPDRGEVNCSHRHGDFAFGSTCAFSCQTGFVLMGPESHECTATGTWTGDAPRCEAITCPVLSAPDQGELNCSHLHGDFAFGSTCVFSCRTGFELTGPESHECTATGTWTGEAPRCKAIACPVLSAPDRGEMNCSHHHGDFAFGSTCAFSCQAGFALMGPESRECTATGTWTGDAPQCKAIACPVLSAPDQGGLNCSHLHGDFAFGSTCAFSCQTGFALMGPESRECTATGNWTGDAPHCEAIKCSTLATPKMGQAACSHLHGDFAFGSMCVFSCQTGFVLMGPESRKCMSTGTWTGDAPHCKAISCPVLDPPSRGQLSCSHLHGNFTYNSTCTFSCEEGFVRMGAEVLRCTATGNWTRHPPVCAEDGAPFLKQVLAYSSGTALAVAGIVLSGTLIALLAKRLSDRDEKKKLLNPTSDLGSPGVFTNAAYDANL